MSEIEEEERQKSIKEESERISKLLTDMLSEEYIESISIFKRYFVYFVISFFLFIVVIFFYLFKKQNYKLFLYNLTFMIYL